MKKLFLLTLIWVVSISHLTLAHGQEPKKPETSSEYLKLAQMIYPAFRCAIAAQRIPSIPEDEKIRLFTLGYESGKTLLKAVSDGKLDKTKTGPFPIGILLHIRDGGPSIDFVLGKIWSSTIDNYHDNKKRVCPNCPIDDVVYARNKFDEMNCALLK